MVLLSPARADEVGALMALADDDPYVEELLGNAPGRAAAALPGRELRAEMAIGALLLAAVAALAILAPSERGLSPLVAFGLVAAFVVAQQVQFEVGIGYTVPSQLVVMPMLILAPPAMVPLLVAAGLLVGRLPSYLRREVHPTRVVFVLPDAWYAVGPALVIAVLGPAHVGLEDWPVLALALGVQALFDAGFTGLRIWLALGTSPQLQLRPFAWVLAVDAALAPVGVLAGVAGEHQPLAVALVLPIMGLLALFARERRAHIDKALALSHAYRGTALLMSDLLEADDAYTGGEHSHGVVALALAVGDTLGLDARGRRNLEFGALLHDIGKIRVPDEIINKPGKLTDEEFAVVKRHPVDGQQMLERVGGVLAEVGTIVRHHHERWEGGGYPDGIAGKAIPLAARIICACDTYSAMTTNRPYRAALPAADALAELERCSGSQFDPAVVKALLRTVAKHPEHRPARALLELVA
jgi:HD-GYP domain-containing protein (c-di-GMP phosphodiesterase class II)